MPSEIHYDNYRKKTEFMAKLKANPKLKAGSLDRYSSDLDHVLRWLGPTPLGQAMATQPDFQQYLLAYRKPHSGEPLSVAYADKIVKTSKRFLRWVKINHPAECRELSVDWIENLCPPLPEQLPANPLKEPEYYRLDEVLKIARLPVEANDWVTIRDIAQVALQFVSGMRAGAATSLPIGAIHLADRKIRQWPSLGVRTKNSQSRTTFLLNIAELLTVIQRWDDRVRAELPDTAVWYAPAINHWGDKRIVSASAGRVCDDQRPLGKYRQTAFNRRLRNLCDAAGVPYKSSHKLRHGHVVWGLSRCRNMADYKALSLNIMHANMTITDEVYAVFNGEEIQSRLEEIAGRESVVAPTNTEVENFLSSLDRDQAAEAIHVLANRLRDVT